ncbi:MAG TPA: hypothetical protein VFS21_33165 [Roseiflexaceae bacterium]|nr:hypothetical protein [Roseiflexaceae bacterium]
MISFSASIDIDQPLDAVRAALVDPARWPELLPGLRRSGSAWRYGAVCYGIACAGEGGRLRWSVAAAGGTDLVLEAELTLSPTSLGCEAALTVCLPSSGAVPRPLLRRRLARAVEALLGRLAALRLVGEAGEPAERYPRTAAAFRAMGAEEHLERVVRLDAVWAEMRRAADASQDCYRLAHGSDAALAPQPADDYDLIYAGGGLGLLHAALMAQRYGYRVLLFDRGEAGCAHREWNISREELSALVESGFCTWQELTPVVMAEYERGVVRFYAEGAPAELWLEHVLDVALDAGALLRLARRKLEQAGGTVLDRRVFRRVWATETGPARVAVDLAREDGTGERYTARLLLDGMGSISPLALRRFAGQPFAGVCPTVGTVVAGLAEGDAPDEHNPQIGEILLSVAHAQRGQQYMWEGFPGRHDELTVYLFYYDTLARRAGPLVSGAQPPNLMQLFEDYFALLPTYKRPGPAFRHLKPVYGYIPARHSVRRQEAPLLRGVLPIGDSAAQQSPLTFCGFGSHVRNLARTTGLLDEALRAGLTGPEQLRLISPYQINVSLNWVFSRFMQPWDGREDVNRLQNIFLGLLNDLGHDLAQRFFRDQMRWGDYHRMVLGMFARHPQIVLTAWRVLGARGAWQWAGDYLAYSRAAALAALGCRLGPGGRAVLTTALGRVSPVLAFRLRARFAEWRAMGWDRGLGEEPTPRGEAQIAV